MYYLVIFGHYLLILLYQLVLFCIFHLIIYSNFRTLFLGSGSRQSRYIVFRYQNFLIMLHPLDLLIFLEKVILFGDFEDFWTYAGVLEIYRLCLNTFLGHDKKYNLIGCINLLSFWKYE